MRRILICCALAALPYAAQAEDLYKCTSPDKPPAYTKGPVSGMTCSLIATYTEPLVTPIVGAPSILAQCLDKNAGQFQGPSARARECTRLHCSYPQNKAIVEAYALGKQQPAAQQRTALICITRREQDMRTR